MLNGALNWVAMAEIVYDYCNNSRRRFVVIRLWRLFSQRSRVTLYGRRSAAGNGWAAARRNVLQAS